tara:strand:+ start:37 stop:348 length:312 start_codon:yes stop_codon:yes gene_type:complete
MEKSPKFFGYVLAFAFWITFLMSFDMATEMIENRLLRVKLYYLCGLSVFLYISFISLVGSIRIFSGKTPIFPLWLRVLNSIFGIIIIGGFILMSEWWRWLIYD